MNVSWRCRLSCQSYCLGSHCRHWYLHWPPPAAQTKPNGHLESGFPLHCSSLYHVHVLDIIITAILKSLLSLILSLKRLNQVSSTSSCEFLASGIPDHYNTSFFCLSCGCAVGRKYIGNYIWLLKWPGKWVCNCCHRTACPSPDNPGYTVRDWRSSGPLLSDNCRHRHGIMFQTASRSYCVLSLL